MNNLYVYQQSLNALHFTPEQKAALAARTDLPLLDPAEEMIRLLTARTRT